MHRRQQVTATLPGWRGVMSGGGQLKTNGRSPLNTASTGSGLKSARRAPLRSADAVLEPRAHREQPALKPRQERVAYLDNLKLLLVAVIIAGHGALAYGSLENAWPYQEVQEVQLAAVSDVALAIVVIPVALFAMGLFFLISGLVTPGSLSRKGPRTFARDRLVRLGLPLGVWALIIWPGTIWATHLAAGETHSFWWQFMHLDPALDTGPMWFVEVLLIYSLAYAAWRHWRQHGATGEDPTAASDRRSAVRADARRAGGGDIGGHRPGAARLPGRQQPDRPIPPVAVAAVGGDVRPGDRRRAAGLARPGARPG